MLRSKLLPTGIPNMVHKVKSKLHCYAYIDCIDQVMQNRPSLSKLFASSMSKEHYPMLPFLEMLIEEWGTERLREREIEREREREREKWVLFGGKK